LAFQAFIELIARAVRISCERRHPHRRLEINVEQTLQQTNAIDAISRELVSTQRLPERVRQHYCLQFFPAFRILLTSNPLVAGAPAVAIFLAVTD